MSPNDQRRTQDECDSSQKTDSRKNGKRDYGTFSLLGGLLAHYEGVVHPWTLAIIAVCLVVSFGICVWVLT